MVPKIKYLFEPRSVALIGASHKPDKIGYKLLENIRSGGYRGKVYPVNPQGGKILGYQVYQDMASVPGEVDLVTIAIPARFVLDAVKSCPERSAKFLSIISSGFAETGNLEAEQEIVRYSREHGMRVLGPNIFGIYSARSSLNATFGPRDITPGSAAIITQSGALGIGMIGRTALEKIGLSAMVSVGNKSDIDESDLLEYLVPHPGARIIMMYIEGIKQGERLIESLKRATRKKPVIVLKSGRSRRGAVAAASHTGSLAGADAVFDAIMRQCGVLRAETMDEAFRWVRFLPDSPLPRGENTVIVTNGGGIGVLATDAAEKFSLSLYDNQAALAETFQGVTPAFGSTKNPVDLTGQADAGSYRRALDAALRNPGLHSVLALYCQTAVFEAQNLPALIEAATRKYRRAGKPLVFSVFGGRAADQAIGALREKRIAVFPEVYEAVNCLGALYAHYRCLREPAEDPEDAEMEVGAINAVIARARDDGRNSLLINESQEVMRLAGIPVPKSAIAASLEQAVAAAEKIGYPLVMKIVSKDILHKSDVGGVALDLLNKGEVIDAFQAIMHHARAARPEAGIEGVEISQQAAPGLETIVGARRDKVFGPILMFGSGGKYVEVLKDVAFRALPLSRRQVRGMIESLRSYPLFLGVRGEKPKDVAAVIDMAIRLGSLLRKCPGISDIEINPLLAYESGQGVMAVDLRILLSQ